MGLRGLDDLAQPKLEMVRGQCHTLEMTIEEVAIIVGQLLPGAARAQMAAQRRHDKRLSLGGGYAADRSKRRGLSLQHRLGDVIAVAGAALVGVSWAHAVAAIVKQAPAQHRGRAPQPAAPRARPGRELGLHRREHGTIHNRRLFAAMDCATVDHLADIEARRSLGWYHKELLVHGRIAEWDRAADPKAFALRGSDLVAHPLPDQLAF